MSEWVQKPLGELAVIRVSSVDKKSSPSEIPIRLCNYMDVYTGTYLDDEMNYMEATASLREISNFSLRSGDVIITKDSESPDDIGIPAIIDKTSGGLVCGYHLAVLRPNPSRIDPLFLLKQMETDSVRRFYLKQAAGSTRYALATGTIGATPIKVAPLDHQKAIGRVLRALDAQIEAAEALIAKQERVRTGMLQDLFTRGVDEHGQLRSSREEAPHLYHDTELGWLPRGWDVHAFQDLVDQGRPISYGILMPGEHVPDGVPVIKVRDIKGGDIIQSGLLRTSKAIDAEYSRSRLREGDLLMTIRGTVGRTAIVPSELSGANITQDTVRLAIARGRSDYFREYLGSHAALEYLKNNTLGNAVQGINLRDVKCMLAPVPPEPEQEAIARQLASFRQYTSALKSELQKLKLKKSGLMQDLLTGKVSVAPLLEGVPA